MKVVYDRKDKTQPFEIKFPKDFERWINKKVETTIIYDRYKKIAHCKRCGHTWSYDDKIRKNDRITCPACGDQHAAVPHTCTPLGSYTTFFWLWNYKGGVRFAIVDASWCYKGEAVDKIRDIVNISVEEIGEISREKQCGYLHWYRGFFQRLQPVYVHHLLNDSHLRIHGGINATIQRSFLKHSDIRLEYGDINILIKKLALYARYPQAEYVDKAGLGELIHNKLYGIPSYIRPNWKADSIPAFLRLSPQDVDKLKQWGCFNVDDIALYQKIKKNYARPKKSNLIAVKQNFEDLRDYKQNFGDTDIVRLSKYLTKEAATMKGSNNSWNSPARQIQRLYSDYYGQLVKLGYPLNDYYLYPSDFVKAHDRVSQEYREEQDRIYAEHVAKARAEEAVRKKERVQREAKEAEELIAIEAAYKEKILPALEKLSYSDGIYLVRPLKDREDFRKEGQNNKNCVFSYHRRAMEGKTNIFVLRKCSAPEVSYVTMEVKDHKLIQCYATGNRILDDAVTAWVNRWLEEVVNGKKRRKSA